MSFGVAPLIKIKELSEADWKEWSRLWRSYLAFYRTELAQKVYTSTFKRLLSDTPYEPDALLATKDGEPIGLVHYLQHRHCWRTENVIYLQDLYVDETARGCGAGRALIEAVYAAASERNITSVYWLTENTNHQAMALYDRVATKTGFIKYQQ